LDKRNKNPGPGDYSIEKSIKKSGISFGLGREVFIYKKSKF